MGPFQLPPFLGRFWVSPLSSRPKKEANSRRIILDLSYPFNELVNDGIDKSYYCGTPINLTYPTIDTFARRIIELQPHKVYLYKRDLARYFRQVPLCPRDYSLIGMRWRGYFTLIRSCLWDSDQLSMCAKGALMPLYIYTSNKAIGPLTT